MYRVEEIDGMFVVSSQELAHDVGVFPTEETADRVAEEMNIRACRGFKDLRASMMVAKGVVNAWTDYEEERARAASW